MEVAAKPERIEAELTQRREDAEKEQHLALQALAGLQKRVGATAEAENGVARVVPEPGAGRISLDAAGVRNQGISDWC
jgi:hypothetical protein